MAELYGATVFFVAGYFSTEAAAQRDRELLLGPPRNTSPVMHAPYGGHTTIYKFTVPAGDLGVGIEDAQVKQGKGSMKIVPLDPVFTKGKEAEQILAEYSQMQEFKSWFGHADHVRIFSMHVAVTPPSTPH